LAEIKGEKKIGRHNNMSSCIHAAGNACGDQGQNYQGKKSKELRKNFAETDRMGFRRPVAGSTYWEFVRSLAVKDLPFGFQRGGDKGENAGKGETEERITATTTHQKKGYDG